MVVVGGQILGVQRVAIILAPGIDMGPLGFPHRVVRRCATRPEANHQHTRQQQGNSHDSLSGQRMRAATEFVSELVQEVERSRKWHAQLHAGSRFKGMKLRKRHRIVLLFWVPFWSLALVTTALAGWAFRVLHF